MNRGRIAHLESADTTCCVRRAIYFSKQSVWPAGAESEIVMPCRDAAISGFGVFSDLQSTGLKAYTERSNVRL